MNITGNIASRWMKWNVPIVLGIIASFALPAVGQQFRVPPSLGEAFEPDYLRRDLPIFVEYLHLQPDQEGVLETLFDEYETKFNEGSTRIRDEVRAMRPEDQGMDEASREELRVVRDQLRELTNGMREKVAATDDPEQRRAVIEEYQRQTQELREKMRDLRPAERDPAAFDQLLITMGEATARWKTEKRALAQTFVMNVQVILTEDQIEYWPSLDRVLRRDKTLRMGRLSAESVNLFDLVKELDLDLQTRSSLDQTLVAYDTRLDEALRARNEVLENTSDAQFRARLIEDDESLETIARDQTAVHKLVRDLNLEFATEIQALLPAEESARFRELFDQKAFARVYRRTNTERSIEAARELADLTPETIAALEELEAAFLAELAPQNERIRQAIVAYEHERATFDIEPGPRDMLEAAGGDPIREAFGDRDELEDRYLAHLKELLTAEQFESIPSTRRFARRGEGRGERGGRGGRFDDRGGGGLERQQWVMDEFDVDKDGRLSPEEIDALRESLRNRRDRGSNDE